MTFASMTNILLVLLCVGVLVQSARLMRSVHAVRSGDLGDTVQHLDRATEQAGQVLGEIKRLLATDTQASARMIASAEILRDELSVMVGIGNAVAERIMEAAGAAEARKEPAPRAVSAVRTAPKATQGSRGRAKAVEKIEKAGNIEKVGKTGTAQTVPAKESKGEAIVAVQPSASVTLLPNLSKAA